MPLLVRGRHQRLALALVLSSALIPVPLLAQEAQQLQEMTVTGTREGELKSETPAAITIIKGGAVGFVKPAHPSEIIGRVPGAVLMQTNGEGHTTGLRQPIGTDAVYSYLEDGVPTRATGFFNHNALFEVNVPQADGIEVTRGPGSALQGSDAIGGVFNVLTKPPADKPEASTTLEAGSYGWGRFLGSASDTIDGWGLRGDLNLTHSDGWRDATGYDRQSAGFRIDRPLSSGALIKASMSVTNVDQQTGANARLSGNDYKNRASDNYHYLAYRKVKAARASLSYEREDADSLVSLTPFVRWNEMDLLASFLMSSDPSAALSGHQSLGLLAKYRHDFAPWRTRLVTGADLDYSPGFREEDRLRFTKSGEFFRSYTNQGRIYDYDVTYMQASPYVHAETSPLSPLRLQAGLRYDAMSYDYQNNLSTGAFTVPNALTSSATTSTYYRPGDTTRYFSHLSPSLGATWAFSPDLNTFARYKHSFRAPSESQLFRSGQNSDSIHLRPVKVDNYEIGLRGPDRGDFTWETGIFHMLKRDDILTLQDASQRISSNNGKTRHYGFEAAASWKFLPEWTIGGSGTYARHRYAGWVARGTSGNVDLTGNDIPTAPRVVHNATLVWQPKGDWLNGLTLEAEWVHVGPYKMDDSNTNTYSGHHLFNLRGAYALAENLELFGRVINVGDSQWATNATYTSGREEFAPGAPLSVFAGITAKF
ncbi:MAG: TonB-dependent receptor [Alphaproteobacteria bacterium]|nr:TonB-dependent receptor [Alphaproteobacteria bacterium]